MIRMNRRYPSGFTLVELMIVVAIIAIIASIAYPNYREHVIKTRRVAATACLMELSQAVERHYTTRLTYAGATLPASACRTETQAHYGYALNVDGNGHVVTAAPTAAQTDSKCGTLTINQTGTRTKTGTASVAECW